MRNRKANGSLKRIFTLLLVALFFNSCEEEQLIKTNISDPVSAVGDIVSITNPGFENNWSGWNDTDPSSISGNSNTGSKSAKITGSGGKFEQTVSVKANTEYALSAYVLGSWRIGANISGTRKTRSGDASSWKKETVTFSTGSATSVTILGEYRSGEGRFDDFELIEGTSNGSGNGNLAESGTASQSSNYSSSLGLAGLAIDGNTNGKWSGGSVTHTQSGVGQWWKVDLGSTQSIGQITIYNRTDGCCKWRLDNITVSVENTSGAVLWSDNVTSSSATSLNVNAGGVSGRVVKITQNANTALSLAEVEVFAGNGTPSNYTSIPAKIEAEDYDDATEGRTETKGSITNVGWIDSGESLSYNVNVPSSGTYTIDFNVASLSNTIKFDIYQGNSKVGDISRSSTGGWSNWVTTSTDVQLSSGNQTIELVATGSGWNINWLEFKTGGTVDPGNLDPSKKPSENFNLSQWKLTLSSGSDVSIEDLNDGFTLNNQFYTDPNDGGIVFKNYPAGPGTGTTSGATQYSRVEFRELLGGENSNASAQGINENNWVFSTSSESNEDDAGGVDGVLTATLKVDAVTETADGSNTKVGRIVIGQIHASGNEPCRLYYKLMPGTTKGAIYFIHEDANGDEFAVNMIGTYSKTGSGNAGDFSGDSEPSDGIPLGEVFSYKIEVIGNMLYVDIYRDNHPDVSESYNMSSSGYANDWMYFKAGLYSQNDQAESSSDYEQVTFYALENTHN